MKVLEYDNKELKQKMRAVDIESLLEDIEFMEKFHGATPEKIYEHWHSVKRELLQGLTAEKGKK